MPDMTMSRIGRRIARGATADIFSWGDHHILKLYRPGSSPTVADREAAHARLAHAAGARTPGVIDVISLDGRVGVIFERASGPTMLEALRDNPGTADTLARQFAALHLDLHARHATQLPAQRQRLRVNIGRARGVTDGVKAAASAALDVLSDGDAVCHGDFHPGNIIMTAGGPVVIDWLDATRGHPLGDLARTSLLFSHAELPSDLSTPHATRAIGSLRAAFYAVYMGHYAKSQPIGPGQLEAWALPVAVARLSEPVSDAEYRLLVALVQGLPSAG